MKTLDEVIKAVEEKLGIGGEEAIESSLETDALYYLRELRHILDNTVWVESTKEEKGYWKLPALPETGNDPLTWDELRTMEGKPVWVEYNFQINDKEFRDNSKRWCIVREFEPWHDTEIIITENGLVLAKNEQVKDWQAYRKERE